ncbi:MAG: endonuclease/exonuclease/phosphatase family protein [Gammaproteobacteria bacterium]|nr:endonuclease/exonuclease/phosphatase family protein [Gammaproteobacteria bacterium]
MAVSSACSSPARRDVPELKEISVLPFAAQPTESVAPQVTVRVMTLNAAHGRGTGFHQLLQPAKKQRRNIARIGALLQREQPHLVALQEADAESFWSGNFNHVRFLAEAGRYRQYVHNELVDKPGLAHGTALISALTMNDPLAVTFRPSPGGTAKGFVLSTVVWPGSDDLLVDVLSVHLEAFRSGLRARQLDELIESVSDRNRPLIVMGDFNTRWQGRRNVLPRLTQALNLQAYEPDSKEHASLPMFKRRVDWILVSPEFEFVSYETLSDVVSDHRPVVAEIALRRD